MLITTPEHLLGKKVGVQNGTTSELEALKYSSTSAVMRYEDYINAISQLKANTIDAIIIDLTGAKGLVDANQDIKIASDPFTSEYYGVVMKKNNSMLKEKVNKAIYSLSERGILNTIKHQWFE